ncbi:sigma-54-dependent transcriptional regulator [Hyalangium versicolor]|uniref:sigma-54-dependent transcriptional regulator n=1 Tax=Hyalangium versicolor TaxID=2861190 RepID=UPI001CCF85F7|nr:sigma-54 dependent transcriptional regulator [Hyalangium versicolor]
MSVPPGPASRSPVLYVDDEPDNLELFRLHFEEDFEVRTATNGPEALVLIERERIGLILTDERMPGMSGIELLSQVVSRWPETVRVIVSAYNDADRLLAAINRGHAHEYIVKPWDAKELRGCVERGLAMVESRRRLTSRAELAEVLEQDAREERDAGNIIGASGGLQATLQQARRAAQSDATVLIHGETGTGKELIARFIHEESRRATGPFVRVNCAALAEGVLESELFGHEQGAFTGAVKTRRGRFELAHGGTIFLDEIGDISPRLQVSLLRVLQEREFERVGGNQTLRVNVRVIAATHRNLAQLSTEGRFREDLYYRLNVLPLTVPALRQRPQDLEALVTHFIAKHGGPYRHVRVGPGVVEALARYRWPGNVRELENLVQRALVQAQGEELLLDDFCLTLSPVAPALATNREPTPGPEPLPGTVREEVRRSEMEQLRELLVQHGGNCSSAARALGIPRTTLISRAKKHGLL